MPQNKEATAFLERIKALPLGPGVSLDETLKPSIEDEIELRRYFASDRGNARLADPCVGLVDVFDAPADIRTTRARVVKEDDDGVDLIAKHIMPVPKESRRPEGAPAMVEDLEEFKKNWSIFTEGSLSQLVDWNNVVAAGGSVLACLTPLNEEHKVSKRAIRKYYHSMAYPTSDVDLFLWGLTPEQAEAKIVSIYEAVRDSVPWDVTCIRSRHTVSIHSQYPYRSVQIVLRLYHSPAEILAGFDIDAPCCAYDGTRVWANPRAVVSMMRQSNTVDMTRRSPSYEVRLAKYANRGFEVYVPDLARDKVDPTIYERSIVKMEGLARLLVFEKLIDGDARYAFLESRRLLRGRPNPLGRYRREKQRYKGDLKVEKPIGGLEMNDYDVTSLHIPYGPGWDARRIDKLVYQTDLGMNSTFNPKNKGRRLHRHPAFFGTIQECLEDCCEACPEPIDDDERALIEKEDGYIIGRIKFIEENPGRQTMTGSFNPIDVGEWSEQVYVKDTEKFFAAVARNDVEAAKEFIEAGIDLNNRDHVGRTCLHVAIISHAPELACELIKSGARISARLVDGRSALHLAARFDQVAVVQKLLDQNIINTEEAKKTEKDVDAMDEDKKPAPERPSSEDDWSSEDNGDDVEMEDADADNEDDDEKEDDDADGSDGGSTNGSAKPAESNADGPPASAAGDLPEDNEDEPDIFDINEADWDFGFTPLAYAILYGSLPMVDLLLKSASDVNKATSTNHHDATQLHPLDITIIRDDEDAACAIAERLIQAGASCTTANEQMNTIFHEIVASGKLKLTATVLKHDPNAAKAIDFPLIRHGDVIFPVVTAIQKADYAMVALLVAYGVKLDLSGSDITRAIDACPPKKRPNLFGYGVNNYIDQAFTPLETGLASSDDIVQLILSFGAAYNLPLKYSKRSWSRAPDDRRTIKDWVDYAIIFIDDKIEAVQTVVVDSRTELEADAEVVLTGWKEYIRDLRKALKTGTKQDQEKVKEEEQRKKYEQHRAVLKFQTMKSYLLDVQRLLDARSAKSWTDLYPDVESDVKTYKVTKPKAISRDLTSDEVKSEYAYLAQSYYALSVPIELGKAYDELFEACFSGDNEKIKQLCLPAQEPTEGGEVKAPLNVNVQMGDAESTWNKSGWTPLFAACMNRHWETAKLIVAIATGQYSPEDKEEEKVTFTLSGINLDDDDSDDGSEASDDTIEQKKEEQFVDIAKIPSTVRSNIHPSFLISKTNFQHKVGDRMENSNLLAHAAKTGDLEAFINIAKLYESLSNPIELESTLLSNILQADSPSILDEYIRRSGYGLDFEVAKKATEHLPAIVNDENRIYLGLNVHGKKRADLARKNDPNAGGWQEAYTVPLVWKAAQANACEIIEYLSSDKPLIAFRGHATSYSTVRAEHLRRTPDLEKVLPEWLGWHINKLGESPLTAAIMGGSLDTLKVLFKKVPQLMKTTLHQTIKFTGHNAFLLAVEKQSKPEILDYLLAKSISPAARDSIKCWNAFHHLCQHNNVELLEHLLKKLPRDVCEALLKQQSKTRQNTPLHVAVANRAVEIVRVVLEFDVSTALITNIEGQTPLHIAVPQGYAKIAKQLLATPQCGGLFLEDSIGQTPYESIGLKHMLRRLARGGVSCDTLSPNTVNNGQCDRLDETNHDVEYQIPRLKQVLNQMIDEGKPQDTSKYAFNINVFIRLLEGDAKKLKDKIAGLPPKPPSAAPEKNPRDNQNIEATWKCVQEALSSSPDRQRVLAKLIDVQQAVGANLEQVRKENNPKTRVEYDSDAEEDVQKKEWSQSMVQAAVNTGADPF